ncbi:MAG: prolyl-tRNA synthetase associated domain-containing protein [Prevotella sp.]|uniref:prolyl-tRNA synthetase associated domain-containing protein n=1 Tax=Prevotella sp. PTAC TaxID=2736295 RepID=UPI001554A30A|nr:YbaK/EbsC family protein [Prevotella sp. PTAC]MCX4293572.1 prolyl-tRNA synthetase associated domain-containing protein [Prevotella sp.]NPD55000.1 prolyl-tRNA synthetase associated domain-containing protein [Prevotella sp. PTAC]
MDKQAIYDYLKTRNISYEATEHKPVYNMDELADTGLQQADIIAKNIFVRDDKKERYYLITVKGKKRINLKEIRRSNGTRRLALADKYEIRRLLDLVAGSVSPLGLLNDRERRVCLLIDNDFTDAPALIGVHPNDNTATITLRTEDLIRIIKEHGNEVRTTEIKDTRGDNQDEPAADLRT